MRLKNNVWLYIFAVSITLTALTMAPARDLLFTVMNWTHTRATTTLGVARPPAVKDLIRSYTNQLQVGTKPVQTTPPEATQLKGPNTLTETQIETILRGYNSPAQGYGWVFVREGERTGIDNAWVLAQFIQESGAGSNSQWAGLKPDGTTTANSGNLEYAPGYGRYGRFADFNGNWEAGIAAHFDQLKRYTEGTGPSGKTHTTIDTAMDEWAPPVENNTNEYTAAIKKDVSGWRSVIAEMQHSIEISTTKKLPTSDYRISARFNDRGEVWAFQGGQHLGTDVLGVEGQEVYAPVDGFYLSSGSYPEEQTALAGAYIMYVSYDGVELYFGHLRQTTQFAVGEGIPAGTVLGTMRGDKAHVHIQAKNADDVLIDFEEYMKWTK